MSRPACNRRKPHGARSAESRKPYGVRYETTFSTLRITSRVIVAMVPCLVLASLMLVSGCRRPLQVVTSSKIFTSTVPVDLRSDTIPVQVDLGNQPVRVEAGSFPLKDDAPLREMPVTPKTYEAGPKIALIDVDGLLLNKNPTGLLSAGENPVATFREKLDTVAAAGDYRAVVLRINSPGGGVTASDIMRQDLRDFKQQTNLPVVACLMDVAAGGAYYIATEADHIVAHPTSLTGGIGVILNLYDLEDALGFVSILGVPVKAGENVDLGTPLTRMPRESRQLLQQIADEFHLRFQNAVAEARPRTRAHADTLYDGRVVTATLALETGLIDRIAYLDDALQIGREMGQCPDAAAVILHRPKDPARTPYAITPNTPIQKGLFPNFSGIDRSHLPTFMYIWQPDPAIEVSQGN